MADTTIGSQQSGHAASPAGMLSTIDGVPLKTRLARATRKQKTRAFMLVLPLLLFVLLTFLAPLGLMLFRSVDNYEFGTIFHRTAAAIPSWTYRDGELPPEEIFAAFAADMAQASKEKTIGRAATRFNFVVPGTRAAFTGTARKVKAGESGPWKEKILSYDRVWSRPDVWGHIRQMSKPLTPIHFLNSLDLATGPDGGVVSQPEDRQIYVTLFIRTLWLSGAVTIACILLGYPVAFLLASLPMRYSNLLLILVLLPFWTSLLVRTTSWIALLQTQGVINDLLVAVGIISDEGRIQMIFNATGTVIAMTHILLPFMILPLYSVMKTISPSYVRAARSLGATQWTAFWRVYFPQTVPGIGAGAILVFILAIGYYITPALVGGQSGQLISNLIAYHMKTSLNWGLAAALSALLLIGVLVLYWVYNRIVGVDNMKLG
ncbi:MAG: ABC transporter permease subunit [Rhizobiales bacterium]|nr:ABC transporter permease subunit [Hyphomicrobiales bacterium]